MNSILQKHAKLAEEHAVPFDDQANRDVVAVQSFIEGGKQMLALLAATEEGHGIRKWIATEKGSSDHVYHEPSCDGCAEEYEKIYEMLPVAEHLASRAADQARIAELELELEQMKKLHELAGVACKAVGDELAAEREKVRKLREALEWYKTPANLVVDNHGTVMEQHYDGIREPGYHADQALRETADV